MQTENCTRVIICCGNDRKILWMYTPPQCHRHMNARGLNKKKNNCSRHSNIIIPKQWIVQTWHWQLYHVNCMHYIKFSCHILSPTSQLQEDNIKFPPELISSLFVFYMRVNIFYNACETKVNKQAWVKRLSNAAYRMLWTAISNSLNFKESHLMTFTRDWNDTQLC